MTVPPTVQSGGRRLIDRRLFWYVLLLLALVLLLLSFWVWNRPTDAELGLLSTHLGGTP
jgi:hypothetical protein